MLRWLREVQYLLEYLLLWPLVALMRRADPGQSRRLARSLGRIGYRVLGHERQWCKRNLELVFGDQLSPGQRTKLAMQAFEHTALTRIESLSCSTEVLESLVLVRGEDVLSRTHQHATREGKGVILIGAHLGNFELLGHWLVHRGYEGTFVYRPQNNWRIESLLLAGRHRHRLSPRTTQGMREVLSGLRNGRTVMLLIDINTLRHPVFVEFLGFPAASPQGAAALALATGAPVMLGVSIREADGRHRLIFHPPFELIRTGDRRHDIQANTQQFTTALEPYILAYPEQYNWLHPRWRLRPKGRFWRHDQPLARMQAERCGPPREPGALFHEKDGLIAKAA